MNDSSLSEPARSALRLLYLDRIGVEVTSALQARGVSPILLKGPTTARWLYQQGERHYVDVDLLIASEQVSGALQAVRDLGFVAPLGQAAKSEQDGHSIMLRSSGKERVELDLHFSLPGAEADPTVVWRTLNARRQAFQLLGQQVDALDCEGRTLVVALHAARNGGGDQQSLTDWERALDLPETDWSVVVRLAAACGATAALRTALEMLPAGARLQRQLNVPSARSLDIELRQLGAHPLAYGIPRLLKADSRRALLAIVFRELWPTRAFLEHWAAREGIEPRSMSALRLRRLAYLIDGTGPAIRAYLHARARASDSRDGPVSPP